MDGATPPRFGGTLVEHKMSLEARERIELSIKVLQTFALPLGYRAASKCKKEETRTILTLNTGREELANCATQEA